MYTTIQELKTQLNIETTYVDEDVKLLELLQVAEYAIDKQCNHGLSGYTDATMPITIKQAVLMLASHLYLNRTPVAFASAIEIPYSIQYLLSADRNLIVE